ncbi:MAG: tetratricopeptide repeat protein, partial [Blastocatellia bacterium]|nr:tetratricopeptide repeat protein [Blastocatellia bacterium]
DEALGVNPKDERLLRKTAIACEKLGRKSEAIGHWRALAQVLRKQAKAHRGEPGFMDRLLKLEQHVVALMLETESSGEEVYAELDAALKFDPDNHELRIMLVEILMELDKPKQALKQLEIIEKKQGVSVELLVLKAETLDQLERSVDAWEVFEQALELDPSSPLARRSFLIFLGEEASKATEEDDYGLAMDICRRQLSLDPDYGPALCQLATLHLLEGEKDQGKELLARMLSADPQMAQKYVMAGGICLDAGLKKDAVKYFEKAIEMEPDVECYFNIGLDYWTAGYEKEGLKYFNKAAEDADIETLMQMAVALAERGGSRESDPFLKKAIKLEPLNPITHMIRGMILTGIPGRFYPSRDDLKEARLEFDEAERLMIGREEHEAELHQLRDLKRTLEKIERTPTPFFGGIPFELLPDFLEDDEPSSESEFKPKTKWRRR